MFTKETYISRREQLKKAIGQGVLLFLGNDESPMNYTDNTYRFRQDSTFLYYFGLDYSGLAAVIDIDEGREIIFGNELTIDDIVWMGMQPNLVQKSSAVGVADTMPLDSLRDYLCRAVKQGRKVHFLPSYRPEHNVKLMNLLGIAIQDQPGAASVSFIKAVVAQRNHKTAEEIEEIEKAVDVSVDMHLTAYRMVRPGVHEAEIAAAVEQVTAKLAGTLSFPTIATNHGQVLHNHGFIHTLREGDLFLLDAGAETASHYCGDLSSSMPVSGKFTREQELIYEIHLSSFWTAVDMLKPGVPFRDIHIASAEKICEGMKDLGLVKGNCRDAAESGAYALFFPCGLGHMMGLDVHDMENLGEQYVGYPDNQPKSKQFGFKSLRLARPLEPGFVFTVEPGIYFMPELIDLWKSEGRFKEFLNYDKIEHWKDFGGLRNELNYLITEDGARLLGSKRKPMSIEEVYNAMNI